METVKTQDSFRKVTMFILNAPRDKRTPTTHTLKCIDEVTIRKPDGTLEKRMIRLIDGERSIFADEQDTINKITDQRAVDKRIKRLHINDGILAVANYDVNTLEFLRLSNYNRDNELRDNNISAIYYEYKPEVMAQKAINDELTIAKANEKAFKMSILEAKAYLATIATDQGYVARLEEKSSDEIRYDILQVAKRNPQAFLEGLNTQAQKNKHHIMRAAALGLIKINQSNIVSADGHILVEAPSGVPAANYFAERAVNDAAFRDLIEQLKNRMASSRIEENESEEREYTPTAPVSVSTVGIYEGTYQEAKAKGIIRHVKLEVVYQNADGEEQRWSNKHTFIKELETNDTLFNSILAQIKASK